MSATLPQPSLENLGELGEIEVSYLLRDCIAFDVAPLQNDSELDKLRVELRTKAGLMKLHRQYWHISGPELARRVLPLFAPEDHAAIRKLCETVAKACPVCRKHQRPGNKPNKGGLWAVAVNDIVASDVFKIDKHEFVHIICLFSGFSLIVYVGQRPTTGEDVISALYSWLALFGPMRVFFTDAGGEYSGKGLNDMVALRGFER